MSADLSRISDELNLRFFLDHPVEAAHKLESLPADQVIDEVARQPAKILAPVWRHMMPEAGARLLVRLPQPVADQLLIELQASHAVRLLAFLPDEARDLQLQQLDPAYADELRMLLSYPEDTAGRLMNSSISTYRKGATVGETLQQLRSTGMTTARSLFLVDSDNRLAGKVSLTDLALAEPDTPLSALEKPVTATVAPIAGMDEISDVFEAGSVLDLPVIDLNGTLLGAVSHEDIGRTIQDAATADLQTMVGASAQERALSPALFAVKKRMPWLQINLITAFMAASVVGLFEATIAQVTALAVLLPVVAGQSGNTGAQALAVTMRGLALREITVRQWARVMRKEVLAGLINGVGIAVTCGIGVYLWSGSAGLVAVIMISMVMAMVSAGFAGAVIPVVLTRLGQDPATSSSIILTTVTDIAGFFSFLGIATILMSYL